jgi:hypothetical protein
MWLPAKESKARNSGGRTGCKNLVLVECAFGLGNQAKKGKCQPTQSPSCKEREIDKQRQTYSNQECNSFESTLTLCDTLQCTQNRRSMIAKRGVGFVQIPVQHTKEESNDPLLQHAAWTTFGVLLPRNTLVDECLFSSIDSCWAAQNQQ